VKLPAERLAVPVNCVAVLPVSEAFVILQGAHPGPVKNTKAVAGSKALPVIVKVNDCPAMGAVGTVVIPATRGAQVVALDTVMGTPVEAAPVAPFCIVTVKLPA